MTKKRLAPSQSVSLRQLATVDVQAMENLLDTYYPLVLEAFPIEGEIEMQETFQDNLLEQDGNWDIIVLKDENQNIIGGIHYQVLSVNGITVNKVAWVEHVWIRLPDRSYKNFRELIRVARDAIKALDATLVFLEFNNPAKMTVVEIKKDAESGITTIGRIRLLIHIDVYVAVNSEGEIAAYGQPSMDGQPPVECLSIGFICDQSLAGKTIPASDYLRILHAAHLTIDGVDLDTDPQVVAYTNAVEAGQDLRFVHLSQMPFVQ